MKTATPMLVKRNVKLFFKDKGTFFTALITPLILLVLYATFLNNVYRDSFLAVFEAIPTGLTVDADVLDGLVGGLLLASLLSVSTVTTSFCANLCMVQDKVTGARNDFTVSPVSSRSIAAGYYLATAINGAIISLSATAIGLGYLAITGWYLSALDVLALFADVVLLVLFGTALSSLVCYPLSSQGQLSAVGTVVSAGYGFICGAYMPLSTFSEGLRNVLAFFPGTYGTSLLRNHALRGALSELSAQGFPDIVITELKNMSDCNFSFFGSMVEIWQMYLVIGGVTAGLIVAFPLLHFFASRKNTK